MQGPAAEKAAHRAELRRCAAAEKASLRAERLRVGRAIEAWREHERLRQEEVAAKLGRSMSTVQRWERGLQDPRLSDIVAMEKLRPGLVPRLFPHVCLKNGG